MLYRPLTDKKDLAGFWPNYEIVDHDPNTVWLIADEPLVFDMTGRGMFGVKSK